MSDLDLSRLVKPLEWVVFDDRLAKAQAWLQANYLIQRWSDGRYELCASYPGYGSSVDGADRFHHTMEAAQAAANADYAARVMAAIDTALIAELVGALDEVKYEYDPSEPSHNAMTMCEIARAALAAWRAAQ